MSDPVNVKGGLKPVTVSLKSGGTNTVNVNNTVVSILEMEDVLFHHDSAVMMPEKPGGTSSSDGTEDDATNPADQEIQQNQEQTTGISTLAIVFRQIEFFPDRGVLIAGHTDTSGGYALNYTLAKQRAQNVLFLLLGGDPAETDEDVEEGDAWAAVSAERHKIEDYQQILTHFALRGDISAACNPGGITNSWNAATESACNTFFDERIPDRSEELKRQVKSDARHRWPEEVWKAVYSLYKEQLRSTLNVTQDELRAKRETLASKFSAEHPYVACGESFPIENSQQDNYRSQKNRRVEILFVEPELLENINCPAATNRKHKTRLDNPPIECPLWHPFSDPEYIDPNDLYAVLFHLKFRYYNRIKKAKLDLPAGCAIQAFRQDGTRIPSRVTYSSGVYSVVVQFTSQQDATDNRNTIYFRFLTTSSWVRTENEGATPGIISRPDAEVEALNTVERQQFYDVPSLWDSRNWLCRFGARTDEFSTLVTETTSSGSPLEFDLDTIVLYDTQGGTQAIQDEDQLGSAKALDGSKSRVKLFMIDQETGRLSLYTPEAAAISARILFGRNRIASDAHNVAIVYFKERFYTVLQLRSHEETNWAASGYLVGARAAVHASSKQVSWPMKYNRVALGYTGDYDLHFFYHLNAVDSHPVSYLLIYVSANFMRDSHVAVPSQAAVDLFVNEGVYNVMERYNHRHYFLEESPASATADLIQPLYFMDEKETFAVDAASRPTAINYETPDGRIDLTGMGQLQTHAAVRTARQNAYGGKPKFLSVITNDSSPTSHYGSAYHWAGRGATANIQYSFFRLNESAYHEVNGPFSSYMPSAEDGRSYQVFTAAHEVGHATGNADEYFATHYRVGVYSAPSFEQFFECYTMDENRPALMYTNGKPRLHHLCYYLNQINQDIRTGELKNRSMLTGKEFALRYDYGTDSFSYSRRINATTQSIDLREPMHREIRYIRHNNNPRKILYLALYYVSQDEASSRNFQANQTAVPIEYQAVLVVRVRMSVDFDSSLSVPNRTAKIRQFNQAWANQSCKYRLRNGSNGIENIIIHFVSGFSADDEAGTRNYKVEFESSNDTPHIEPDSPTNDEITVHNNATANEMVAYFLHIANAGDLGNKALMVNHLDFLRTWVNTKLGAAFTLEAV